MQVMSQAEFARHINVSRVYVTQLKHEGRIVMTASGKVDVEASIQRIADTADQSRDDVKARHAADKSGVQPQTDEATPKFSDGRAKEQHYKALRAELEYKELVGELVRKDDVAMAVADMVTTFRQSVENLPHRIAADLVEKDIEFIRATLRQEVFSVLSELQRACSAKLNQGAV